MMPPKDPARHPDNNTVHPYSIVDAASKEAPGQWLVADKPTPMPLLVSERQGTLRSDRRDDDQFHIANVTYIPFDQDFSNPYPTATMSLSYENITAHRTFPNYPHSAMMHDPHQEEDSNIHHNHNHNHRYPSPPPPLSDNPFNTNRLDATALIEEMSELPPKEESDAPSPGRTKPIPKPDREVTKGDDGRYICRWPGCTEEIRTFNRKCEWSKHMDKHDRPYKCPSEGCEKLPGFTYSGGLLRHEREVHNLHGGPRKQLNCPHPNCKRFSGKGFSRQENLNEHLRRVHTDAGADVPNGEDTEDDGNERSGMKRKRGAHGSASDDGDIRQEMARLRQENEDLRRTSNSMLRQLESLQNLVAAQNLTGARMHPQQPGPPAPPANMM